MSKRRTIKMSIRFGIPGGMEDDDLEDDFHHSIQKTCENMKITIVPDITIRAGLNGENFDAKLSTEIESWFANYKQMWNVYKNTPSMIETLGALYANTVDPLMVALKLFANCPDCINVKNKSLPYTIMEKIAAHRTARPEIAELCTDSLRMVAFNFVKKQQLPSLYKLVAVAYDLASSRHLFEQQITELVQQHCYKDAANWAILLGLTHKFGVFEIVLPLVLQDKISVAEEYLDAVPLIQQPTIELLDSLLDKRSSVYNNCDCYIGKYNYNEIKTEKLQSKPLTKLITRLSQKYKIPTGATPHMNRAKSYGYLQYLIHKKYVEKSLNTESWRELVKDTLKMDSQDMHIDLICSISYHSDFTEGVYWVNYFNPPVDSLPQLLQDFLNSEAIAKQNAETCRTDDNSAAEKQQRCQLQTDRSKYYSLILNDSDIVLVDNANLFNEMLEILKVQSLVAFDSEWKPSCNVGNIISLIQIATRNTVYLIDALEPRITEQMWSELGRSVFNNGEIIKIGFSLTGDITMFQKTLPALGISLQVQSSYIDLQIVWRKVNVMEGFYFPYRASYSTNSSIGLSTLVELCLGKQLDKSNQLSNWGNRPLRKDQIIYAALDAYCLLELYDIIQTKLNSLGIDITDFTDNTLFDSILKKSKKKPPANKQKVEIVENELVVTSNRATNVKFLCDEMIEGLAKSLRKCGIDSVCMSSTFDRTEFTNRALNENRIALTKGLPFVEIARNLPPRHCYQIDKTLVDDQLSEVLTHFNIIVTEEDIFSRCMKCNSNNFLLATQAHIKNIKYGKRNSDSKQDVSSVKPPNRSFVLNQITSHTCASGITPTGARIQVDNLHRQIINSVVQFYICEGCGKCYWEGDHFQRAMSGKLKDIISK